MLSLLKLNKRTSSPITCDIIGFMKLGEKKNNHSCLLALTAFKPSRVSAYRYLPMFTCILLLNTHWTNETCILKANKGAEKWKKFY